MNATRTYVVSPAENGTSELVSLDGATATLSDTSVTLVPTDRHGVYMASGDGNDVPIFVESDGIEYVTIYVRGYAYRARVLRQQHHELIAVLEASPAMQTRVTKVSSPMPGLLRSILVSDGEHVVKGQALFTLEAMKMENVISAPSAGTIRNLTATEAMVLEKGAPLCVIEPA